MTVHEAAVGATVEWYTPSSLFEALGVRFDLDPASPCPPVPWVRADEFYCWGGRHVPRVGGRHTVRSSADWFGHVWLNPPYGPAGVEFIDRMIAHADGLLLLPSRTETAAYQRALAAATTFCLLRDRLWFVRNDGVTGRSSFGSTLFAFGQWAADVLRAADLGWMPTPTHSSGDDFHSPVGVCETGRRQSGAPASSPSTVRSHPATRPHKPVSAANPGAVSSPRGGSGDLPLQPGFGS